MKEMQSWSDPFRASKKCLYWIDDQDLGEKRLVIRGAAGTEDLKRELYRGYDQGFCSGGSLLEAIAWITRLSTTIPAILRDGGVMTMKGKILPVAYDDIASAVDLTSLFSQRCVATVSAVKMPKLGLDPQHFHLLSHHSVYIFQLGAADQFTYRITKGGGIIFSFLQSYRNACSFFLQHTDRIREEIHAKRGQANFLPMIIGREKVIENVMFDLLPEEDRAALHSYSQL